MPPSTSTQVNRAWPRAVLTVPTGAADELAAACFDLGSCGLQTEDVAAGVRVTAYFHREANAARTATELAVWLGDRGLGGCVVTWSGEGERDWLRAWRAFYRPVWATPRIVVHPPWRPVAVAPDQVAVAVEPRMAFGTGGHESTQLCLLGIDALVRCGAVCLDVGTGSGVLAIALLRLGASRVVAVDVDEVCVENARHNAAWNLGEGDERLEVRHGSLDEVAEGDFDLVVANLESHLLRPLLGPIADRLGPGGRALLSGLLGRERQTFETWLEAADLAAAASWERNGWLCLAARARRT